MGVAISERGLVCRRPERVHQTGAGSNEACARMASASMSVLTSMSSFVLCVLMLMPALELTLTLPSRRRLPLLGPTQHALQICDVTEMVPRHDTRPRDRYERALAQ